MATHLVTIQHNNRNYFIGHGGETVYYSTLGKGRGTSIVKGLKFKGNRLVDNATGKEVESNFIIGQKISKS